MNINEQDWNKFREMYAIIEARAEEYAKEAAPGAWFKGFTLDEDSVEIEIEVHYCGCCPGDTEHLILDYEDLFDDEWYAKLQKQKEERRQKEYEAAQAKRRQIQAEEKARREKQYNELKKEFG